MNESLETFVSDLPPAEKEFDADAEWKWAQMPEFIQENKEGYQSIIIHFETKEDVAKFAKLLDQTITDKTKYLWYPEHEKQNLMEWVYINEENVNESSKD